MEIEEEVGTELDPESAGQGGDPEEDPVAAELEQMKGRLAEAEEKAKRAEAAYYREHDRGEIGRAMQSELEQAAARAEWNRGMQESLRPPTVEDPHELLSDGDQFMKFLNEKYTPFVRRSIVASLAPFLQEVSRMEEVTPAVISDMQRRAAIEARQQIEAEYGSAADFDELVGEIGNEITSNPRGGTKLSLDPRAWRIMYDELYARRNNGRRPVRVSPQKPPPSPPSGRQPSRQPGQRAGGEDAASRVPPEVLEAAKSVARKLNKPLERVLANYTGGQR